MSMTISFEGTPVARVGVDQDGPRITYVDGWPRTPGAFPISLTMPLAAEPYGPETAVPWLMNLLPEGEPLRAMTRALGVSRDDILGLITATGRDLAGALTIGTVRDAEAPAYLPIIDPAQLERIIEELPAKPFLVGDEGVSMSLAGAQEKMPLAGGADHLTIPINGASSTLILKPDNPRLPGSVQNEALCMVLARRCGLPTAPVTTGVAGARAYLLVDRYDRTQADGRVTRIHQEDFCQALGRPPAAKYQHNQTGMPGPSLAEMFGLVRQRMTAREINRLLDAVIFNIAIGNVDSHAKNYSILLRSSRAELAPLYDLMSGLAWDNITQNHAQDVGDQQRGRHIYGRHWRRMAAVSGLAGPASVRRVQQISARVLAELPAAAAEVAAMPAGGAGLDTFVTAIDERARLVGAHAAIDGDPGPPATTESVDDGDRYG